MISFSFATLSDCCGVACVIDSGCEFGVKLICCSLFVHFVDYFIVTCMSLLMLTAISLINSFMLSFIRSFTSTNIDSRRYFIMSNPWSFQFIDRYESESIVLPSWVFSVVVLWGLLSVVVEYSGASWSPLLMLRRSLSWMVEYPCDWVGPLPLPPLPLSPYLAYAPLSLSPVDWYWNVELDLNWGVTRLLSLCWKYIIGSSSSVTLVDCFFALALLFLVISCGLRGWKGIGVPNSLSLCW